MGVEECPFVVSILCIAIHCDIYRYVLLIRFQPSPHQVARCNSFSHHYTKNRSCFNPHLTTWQGATLLYLSLLYCLPVSTLTSPRGKVQLSCLLLVLVCCTVSTLTSPRGKVQRSAAFAIRDYRLVSTLTSPRGKVQQRNKTACL